MSSCYWTGLLSDTSVHPPIDLNPKRSCCCADLVPAYHLGQSQLLTFWGTEQISRRWRASVGVFWGAYGLPLPRRHPIITLIGSPIPGAERLPRHPMPLLLNMPASDSAASPSFNLSCQGRHAAVCVAA